MKHCLPLLIALSFLTPAFSQKAPAVDQVPTDEADDKTVHEYNMNQLKKHATYWRQAGDRVRNAKAKAEFHQMAAEYDHLIFLMTEKYQNELNQRPVHYEKILDHVHKINGRIAHLNVTRKRSFPKIPRLVNRNFSPEAAKKEPVQELNPTYKTESGFEVRLELED